MNSNTVGQNSIRQYLLGRLPPEQQPSLEERLLIDDALYEELLIIEDELIDQYLAGQISDVERESFETNFLVTPDRQQKVRFARSLKKYVANKASGAIEDIAQLSDTPGEATRPSSGKLTLFSFLRWKNPVLGFSLAAAVLLLMLGASLILMKGLITRKQPRQVITVLLLPGMTRESGELPRIVLSPELELVQFRLGLPTDLYPSYRAVLLNAEGSTVLASEELKPESADDGRIVVLTIPSEMLSAGEYRLKLTGLDDSGNPEWLGWYPFRISTH